MSFGAGGAGSTPWGAGTSGGDAFEFSPIVVGADGGYRVTLRNLDFDGTYRVHFGPNEDTSDPLCYSGIIGQGANVVVLNGECTFWTPPVGTGNVSAYMARVTGSGPATFSTGPVFGVVLPPTRGQVVSLRGLLPRKWRTSTTQVA